MREEARYQDSEFVRAYNDRQEIRSIRGSSTHFYEPRICHAPKIVCQLTSAMRKYDD
ncbi:hypothetical protein RRSWK_00623 [Rhodopirellula sp. SWK7]|nr:hypothetical protein RRSWK_00623 [Rhodopirellula sp. SWK7]